MATVVLVHGAWHGAWCWDRVLPFVAHAGHEPIAVELTGSGARAAELTPDVDLATHVADVAAHVTAAAPVVLVVHSYSGMVAAGVADAVPEALAAVVLVDSFYPEDGDAAIDQMPPPFQEHFRNRAAEVGDGWRLPADASLLDVWGLHDADDRAWVLEHLTDWSLRCFESPVRAPSGALRRVPRWYVSGVGDHPAGPPFQAIGRRAAADGCTLVELACGHDVQVERPAELAAVIGVAADAAAQR